MQLLGAYQTFTGSPASYTPTASGQLLVKSDSTPHSLYRSTGTTLGAVAEIGGGGGGGFREGNLVLDQGTVTLGQGEIGIDTDDFSTAEIFHISDSGDLQGDDWTEIGASIRKDAVLKIVGRTSGAVAYVYVLDSYYLTTSPFGWIFELDSYRYPFQTAAFTDGELIQISFAGGSGDLYLNKTASFTADSRRSYTYFIDCTSGNVVGTLPTALGKSRRSYTFKRIDSNPSHTLTINRSGSNLIDGATSKSLSVLEYCTLTSDGVSNWWIT